MLLQDRLKNFKIILGSRSPRRRELLSQCGITFTLADNYDVEEIFPNELPVNEVPVFLSELKSKAYPKQLLNNEILITADTVVIIDDKIIGKPKDRADAISILKLLSGKAHLVSSGVTLRGGEQLLSFRADTQVYFKELTTKEIEFYIDKFAPFDKAGAYGIQEWIGFIGVERIEGSFYNVMGLPIQKLYTKLGEFIENSPAKSSI